MASSARAWGGCGAAIDMFPSHYMGYLSYARMAGILGKEEERDLGLYFAARAQIPLVARFPFKDEAAEYFLFPEESGRIVSGFGESEPVAPRAGTTDEVLGNGTVDNVKYWADFTISGERIHPLVHDVYAKIGDCDNGTANYFDDLLAHGEQVNADLMEAGNPFDSASFPVDKIHAFRRSGRLAERDALIERVGHMYTPHTSGSLQGLDCDGMAIIDPLDPGVDLVGEIVKREGIFGPYQIYLRYRWDPNPIVIRTTDENATSTPEPLPRPAGARRIVRRPGRPRVLDSGHPDRGRVRIRSARRPGHGNRDGAPRADGSPVSGVEPRFSDLATPRVASRAVD